METKTFICSICGNETEGFGHNPEPVLPYERRCCSDCNMMYVVPARLALKRGVSDAKSSGK